MAFRQLLYLSFSPRVMDEKDLKALLKEARRFNLEHDITGYLLYVERFFMQCIEGAPEVIGQLVENIRKDVRHRDFTTLFDREVEERVFPGWSMGFRTYTVSDLQKEEGFHNIRSASDLKTVEQDSDVIYTLMRDFYVANAEPGF